MGAYSQHITLDLAPLVRISAAELGLLLRLRLWLLFLLRPLAEDSVRFRV